MQRTRRVFFSFLTLIPSFPVHFVVFAPHTLRESWERPLVVEVDVCVGASGASTTSCTAAASALTTSTASFPWAATAPSATACDWRGVEGLLDLDRLLLLALLLATSVGSLGGGVVLVTALSVLDNLAAEVLPLGVVGDGSWGNRLASEGGLLRCDRSEVLVEGLSVVDLLGWSSGGWGLALGWGSDTFAVGLDSWLLGSGIFDTVLLGLELSLAVVTSPTLVDVLLRVAVCGVSCNGKLSSAQWWRV